MPSSRNQHRDVLQVVAIESAIGPSDNGDAKFGGVALSDARKLRALEDENAKLKKLLAEQMLDDAILKDVASKNGDAPLPGWRLQANAVRGREAESCRSRSRGV